MMPYDSYAYAYLTYIFPFHSSKPCRSVTYSQVMLLAVWLVRLLTAKVRSPNSVWQIMNLVSRGLCLRCGRPGLMFRESLGSVVRQTLHSSFLFSLSFLKQPRDQLLSEGKGRMLTLFFFPIPIHQRVLNRFTPKKATPKHTQWISP